MASPSTFVILDSGGVLSDIADSEEKAIIIAKQSVETDGDGDYHVYKLVGIAARPSQVQYKPVVYKQTPKAKK